MVKELVPLIGSRSKILKKIEELKSTNRNVYNGQNTLSDQDPDQALTTSLLNIGATEIMYDFPIEPSSYSTDVSVITAQNTSHHANITSNNLVHNIPSTSNNVQYPGHDSSLINTMLTLSVPTEIRSSTMDNTNAIEAKNLKDILIKYHDGTVILENYEIHNELNSSMRNKLNTLKNLSQAIALLFPNESKETYYTPYKKVSNKLTPARGKLWDKYCNMRREIRNNTKLQSDSIISQDELSLNNKCTTLDKLFEEDIIWLKSNTAPWDLVNIKWKNTFQIRFNSLINGVENNSYLTDYPALKSSLGFTLIELDFEVLYPGKNLVLYNKFEVLKNKLPKYVKKYNIQGVDHQVDVIQNFFELGNHVTIAAFKIFVLLFKPNVSQLKEVDDAKSNKAYRIGQKLQPYMVFVETDDGQCLEVNCNRIYSSFDSFSKHCKSHNFVHKQPLDNIPTPSNIPLNLYNDDDSCISVLNDHSAITDDQEITIAMFKEIVTGDAITLMSKWYNESVVPRNKVQTLINDVNSFNENCLQTLKTKVLHSLENHKNDSNSVIEISEMFDAVSNPFINLQSESVFKVFFEQPNILKTILKYFDDLISESEEIISSYIQSEVWKEKCHEINYLQSNALIIGDNLGLHSILGFSESFMANFPCRICKCSKLDCNYSVIYNNNKLRDEENYLQDLLTDNVSETGIKEACVWNQINGFHAVYNYSVDLMHDVLEETLNNRIQCYNYGILEIQNKPQLISIDV
ncbi:hypothetical protein AGLY_010931 [Aphis glycines]|uniref:C2H2-type domain-containing protein n=1 Tax=Aphis glycines TaxID=307491 RepID=A0A6G0TC69_APHGL|nr:hypothetical protein AGLY_010931 [Aphis glycines]